MTTALERYDTIRDLLAKAITALNDSSVIEPDLPHRTNLLSLRMRQLINTNIALTQRLLDDHAELIGLFEEPAPVPKSGAQEAS